MKVKKTVRAIGSTSKRTRKKELVVSHRKQVDPTYLEDIRLVCLIKFYEAKGNLKLRDLYFNKLSEKYGKYLFKVAARIFNNSPCKEMGYDFNSVLNQAYAELHKAVHYTNWSKVQDISKYRISIIFEKLMMAFQQVIYNKFKRKKRTPTTKFYASVASTTTATPESIFIQNEAIEEFNAFLNCCTEDERKVVYERVSGKSFRQIGEDLKIEDIRQVHYHFNQAKKRYAEFIRTGRRPKLSDSSGPERTEEKRERSTERGEESTREESVHLQFSLV